MSSYKLISADDHISEPPDLWTTRVEAKFKDRAPRIIRSEDGTDWWHTDGIKGIPVVAAAQPGLRFEEVEKLSLSGQIETLLLGAYDADGRIKDMDLDGVEAGVIYPNQGVILYTVPDHELVQSLLSVYNDWLADYCKSYPKRLKGIAMLLLDDIQWAVKELERCHNLGLVGAMIPVYPHPARGYHLPEYEPFWAAAQDLGVPLSLHIGTMRPGPGSMSELLDFTEMTPEYYCNADHWVRMSLTQMIFGGVFERYPELYVGSVEHELSWIPHLLERMDYTYTQRIQLPHWHRFKEDTLPSDYFHGNVFVGFQEDALGIMLKDFIGVDNLQWGSDYPHPESTFPRSRQILDEILAGSTEEEKAKMAGGNAARIYDID